MLGVKYATLFQSFHFYCSYTDQHYTYHNKIIICFCMQISFSFVTFPAILIAYIGQAAFLRKFPEKVENTFYDSIPGNY